MTAMHLQLSDANLTQLAAHIPHVVKLSGAELQLTAGPQGVGLELQGSPREVDSACKLLCLMGCA